MQIQSRKHRVPTASSKMGNFQPFPAITPSMRAAGLSQIQNPIQHLPWIPPRTPLGTGSNGWTRRHCASVKSVAYSARDVLINKPFCQGEWGLLKGALTEFYYAVGNKTASEREFVNE